MVPSEPLDIGLLCQTLTPITPDVLAEASHANITVESCVVAHMLTPSTCAHLMYLQRRFMPVSQWRAVWLLYTRHVYVLAEASHAGIIVESCSCRCHSKELCGCSDVDTCHPDVLAEASHAGITVESYVAKRCVCSGIAHVKHDVLAEASHAGITVESCVWRSLPLWRLPCSAAPSRRCLLVKLHGIPPFWMRPTTVTSSSPSDTRGSLN